ncbi:MAG: two-component regulator propeller domain-containing protein [Bacteroidales bacterium]
MNNNRFTRKIVSIIFILFQFSFLLSSEKYIFERLSEKEGLSSNDVTCVYQDHMGFIWIGTTNGLNLYTGENIFHYKYDISDTRSISNNFIFYISEDADSNLWISTSHGLNRYMREYDHFERYFSTPDDHATITFNKTRYHMLDSKGNFWLSSRKGLNKLEKKSDGTFFFKRYYPKVFEGNDYYESQLSLFNMIEDDQGNIWTGSWGGGLIMFNPKKETFTHYRHDPDNPFSISGNIVRHISFDNTGNMWIGTYTRGVNVFNPKTGIFLNYQNTPGLRKLMHNESNIVVLVPDKKDNLWIGGNSFLQVIDPEKFESLYYESTSNKENECEESLSVGLVRHIYEDQTGIVWVSTGDKAVLKYDPNKDKFSEFFVSLKNRGEKDHVNGFVIDSNKHVWLSTFENGLLKTSGKGDILERFVYPKINNRYINHIIKDKQERIWIGGLDGIELFSIDKNKITNYYKNGFVNAKSLEHKVINKFIIDKKNVLWILTQEGINFIDLNHEDLIIQQFKPDLNLEKIYDLFADDENSIVFCGQDGAAIHSPKDGETKYLFHDPGNPSSLSSVNVNCAIQDKDGYYWFGTNQGLNRYSRKTDDFDVWYEKDGLASAAIYDIEPSGNGVWVRTAKGISHLNIFTEVIKNYSNENGLPDKIKILWKSSDNSIYVAAESGYVCFNPSKIKDNPHVSNVCFTNLKVNGYDIPIGANSVLKKHVSLTDQLVLPYDRHHLQFSFSALNYTLPEQSQYMYFLEGYDTSWQYLGSENKVLLMNLSPGKYTLKVKGSNNDNVWNDNPAKMRITLLPPWWKSWWAYIIYALIFLGLFYLLYMVRKYRLQMEVQKLNARLQHENDQMKLHFFTNISHEFRTPLTLIKGALDQLKDKKYNEHPGNNAKGAYDIMYRNINRLLLLINQVIDLRKLDIGKLKLEPEQGDVIKFTRDIFNEFESLATRKDIRYTFTASHDTWKCWFDKDKLSKILYNLLSNALKYTQIGGTIELTLSLLTGREVDKYPLNESKDSNLQEPVYLELKVLNSGKLIPPDEMNKVFERFYRLPGEIREEQGSMGIGLSLVQELVKLHDGEIKVTSEKNRGNCFTIILPLAEGKEKKINYEKRQVNRGIREDKYKVSIPGEEAVFAMNETKRELQVKGQPILLIIEDNEDISALLTSQFDRSFKIIHAKNGKEGLEKAINIIPDIIISDIMMPVMDGIAFCIESKKHELTCHIPVILLTARSDVESRIKGIDKGADAYISKPYDAQLLKSHVFNLLENRRMLKKKFSGYGLEHENLSLNNSNISFIEKVNFIIDKNLAKEEFNISFLAGELGMSSRQVHRKFKGLMEKSAAEYVRTYKLNQAAKLLLSNRTLSISEIAYNFGYKHNSHFTTSFKKHFGKSPSEYIVDNSKKS